ncbi:FecR family protein [Sphingobacterium sp. Mn56C]|uniref:FecR family protein n=1 Tax=Sphingobacterium sp. Mn56C TaxID=3395261 RepID=UPI003BEE36B7
MDTEELDKLLKRYQEDLCSLSESKVLEDVLFEEYPLLPETEDAMAAKVVVWRRLEHTLFFSRLRRLRWHYAAAVAVLLVVAGTLFTVLYNRPASIVAGDGIPWSDAGTAIQPGENKAILMLADGKTLHLAGAKTGIVTDADGVRYADGGKISAFEHGANASAETASAAAQWLVLKVPRGGQYVVLLADGSRVQLNAESSLRYPALFSGTKREVYLEGEAYFEVNESSKVNQKTPFIVHTEGLETLVYGTKFNINSYDNRTKTTLASGHVRVKTSSGKQLSLIPGEQASFSSLTLHKQKIDIAQELAWVNGKFSFDNKPFKQIMDELARWYDLEVVYKSDIPKVALTGDAFRNQNLRLFLRILDAANVDYHLNKESRILTIL